MLIHIIPTLQNNYVFSLVNLLTKQCFVVDPGESQPVYAYLDKYNLTLDGILLTHHHGDHTDGVAELKARYPCDVYGFQGDQDRLPSLSHPLNHQDILSIGGRSCQIHHIPGHTSGHIAYDFFEDQVCFVGDTLFSMGCGRVFEGTFEQMYQSLSMLRALDPRTKIYCAHEYTQDNIEYVKTMYQSRELESYSRKMNEVRSQDKPTVPFVLGEELGLNPFLAVFQEDFRHMIGLGHLSGPQAFAKLRIAKDAF